MTAEEVKYFGRTSRPEITFCLCIIRFIFISLQFRFINKIFSRAGIDGREGVERRRRMAAHKHNNPARERVDHFFIVQTIAAEIEGEYGLTQNKQIQTSPSNQSQSDSATTTVDGYGISPTRPGTYSSLVRW